MIYIHNINPILISLGWIHIYYYSFAYILGLFLIPYYVNKIYLKDKLLAESFSNYIAFSTIICGRVGYVLFYNFQYYLKNPLLALKIWEGGMSFHGGLIGFSIGVYLFCKKYNQNFLSIVDKSTIPATLCLFIGRIMNFINGELYGNATNGKWGVVFPSDILQIPRHPSQLYEAFAEGLLLFVILFFINKKTYFANKSGVLSGIFIFLYGLFRFFIEFFRKPDEQIGYFFMYITLGQIFCIIMMIFGFTLILKILKKT